MQTIKSQKKIHADTRITSTHFLKECSKVPKIAMEKETIHTKSDYQLMLDARQMKAMQKRNLFQRGAMAFDDFNYESYNEHILIDSNL